MSYRNLVAPIILAVSTIAVAAHSPQHERHELMENTGDAAKVIGEMMRGETAYDGAAVLESLQTSGEVATRFGGLFPAGTESGDGTEAAPSIWEDREGFDAALQQWADATAAAVEASPATLEDAEQALGPVFQSCKNCHDNYRIEDE